MKVENEDEEAEAEAVDSVEEVRHLEEHEGRQLSGLARHKLGTRSVEIRCWGPRWGRALSGAGLEIRLRIWEEGKKTAEAVRWHEWRKLKERS